MKRAICLLTRIVDNVWLDFLQGFQLYDIFVCVDDNSEDCQTKYGLEYPNITFIQIQNVVCREQCYTNCNSCVGFPEIISWDKAIYYFSERETSYDQVWMIEEDVFFMKEQVLETIDIEFPDSDLLTSFHSINPTGEMEGWNHWVNIIYRIDPPWAHSMVCASRISRKLFAGVKKYKTIHGHLFFIEAMFNTIAHQTNLLVDTPHQLSTVHWNTQWNRDEIDANQVYHPFKRIEDHTYIRASQSAGLNLVPPS